MLICLPRDTAVARAAREYLGISLNRWTLEGWAQATDAVNARCLLGMCASEAEFAKITNTSMAASMAFHNVPFVGLPNRKSSCWLAALVQSFAVHHGDLLDPLVQKLSDSRLVDHGRRAVMFFGLAVQGVVRRRQAPYIQSWLRARDEVPTAMAKLGLIDSGRQQSADEGRAHLARLILEVVSDMFDDDSEYNKRVSRERDGRGRDGDRSDQVRCVPGAQLPAVAY